MLETKIKDKRNTVDDQRPFLGLRSFEETNKSQFGGRGEEVNELYGLVENNGLTVVFGKSGIGKTSLIKAGLIPELRQNFYFPIYFRVDYSSTRTPLEQVKRVVYEKMQERDPSVSEIGDVTLWEYFHNVNLLGDLFTPVLILDQFEEVFTLGEGKENVSELLVQLADLAENRIPLKVQGQYQKLNQTVPTHYAEQPYRVILSLREDYLARLEELKKYMPSIMNSRFRIIQMTVGQAMDAAIKPGKGLIDKTVAEEIIKKLPGISQSDFDLLLQNSAHRQGLKVEPFLLSLICDRINEKRIEKELDKITVDLVSKFNVADVINSFYEETISQYGDQVERAIENSLLTEGGFRKLQALEEFQIKYEISDEVISRLVDARILRKEIRDGVDYIELIHDVLAPVIKRKRDKRARLEREEERQAAIIRLKRRQRAKQIRVTSFIGVFVLLLFAMLGWSAYDNWNDAKVIKERITKMTLARDLLKTSKITGSVDGDTEKATLLARLAYLIYDKNKDTLADESMYRPYYYNGMYEALKNNGFYFFVNWFDSGVQSIAHANGNEIYVGLMDSTLRIMQTNSDIDSRRYKFYNGMVTSMDVYEKGDKHLLAIAGTFDSIFIHDLSLGSIVRKIAVPGSDQGKKSITFTGNGGVVLRQESSILHWNNSLNSAKNIGFRKDSTVSAIQYLPTNDSLIIGNRRGEIYMAAIENGMPDTRKHLAHTSVVTDISVSDDGKWIATSSSDNTIVVWDRKTWRPMPITTNVLNTSHGFINGVSFSPEGKFLLAGYEDGTVLRWPISLEILDQLICEEINQNLSDNDWTEYAKNLIVNQDEYNCR